MPRRGSRSKFTPLGGLLVVVGLMALSLTAPADSRMAVPLIGALLLVVTFALGRLRHEPRAADFLLTLMLVGLGLRFLTLALIYQSVGPFVFAPDAGTYQDLGLRLARYWSGQSTNEPTVPGLFSYYHLNGVIFYVVGEARAVPNLLNAFFGAWAAIPTYYLGQRLVRDNDLVPKAAALLVVLFPSMILWSVLNIREAPTILAIVTAVYLIDRLRHDFRLSLFLGAALALGVLALSREYMMALVGLSAGAGLLIGLSAHPVRSLVVGTVVIGVVVFVIQSAGIGGPLLEDPTLENLEFYRDDLAFGAGSSYGEEYDVSTPAGALAFLPIGLTYFLFAPFPWSVTSFLQVMTLPETFIWYALFPFGVWGIYLALRHRPGAFSVVLSVMVAVTVSYALVEGNVGTAYRHRAQILPLIFVFCAVGLSDAYAIRARKRRRRTERRRKAEERLVGGRARRPGTAS